MSISDGFKFFLGSIPCQRCVGKPASEGCATCGGYRVVLNQHECPVCKRQYWARPGVHTVYAGKKWVSVDGLEMVWDGANVCLSHWEPKS